MKIIINKPTGSQHEQTLKNVRTFSTDYGHKNTISVKYKDNTTDTFTGIGYAVSAASETTTSD